MAGVCSDPAAAHVDPAITAVLPGIPISPALLAALPGFLAACGTASSADTLLAHLKAHAAAHNPDACEWLASGCPSLTAALRRHPTFFAASGLLAHIIGLASALPSHFPRGLPLLAAAPCTAALPRAAVASLLACMFLCVLPRTEDCSLSHFAMLFALPAEGPTPHKLLCVLHYFQRTAAALPQGVLVLERAAVPAPVAEEPQAFFAACAAPMQRLEVLPTGSIGDARGCLLGDFANEYIGGGVLGGGAVQEEIMFITAPETLCSLLLCPAMAPHEAIVVAGAERFSAHTGYDRTFAFAGDLQDPCPRVPPSAACGALTPGSAVTALVAFDALPFFWREPQQTQLRLRPLHRELVKATAAFGLGRAPHWPIEAGGQEGVPLPIATGHWGCGAFHGASAPKVPWATEAFEKLVAHSRYPFTPPSPHAQATSL